MVHGCTLCTYLNTCVAFVYLRLHCFRVHYYRMKNITLSADEKLIEQARKTAAQKGSTLNKEFRAWLAAQAVSGRVRAAQYKKLMEKMSRTNAGRKFTRDEMNKH